MPMAALRAPGDVPVLLERTVGTRQLRHHFVSVQFGFHSAADKNLPWPLCGRRGLGLGESPRLKSSFHVETVANSQPPCNFSGSASTGPCELRRRLNRPMVPCSKSAIIRAPVPRGYGTANSCLRPPVSPYVCLKLTAPYWKSYLTLSIGSHTRRMGIPSLPQELIELIIDDAYKSNGTAPLKCLSRVSRAWRPRSQNSIFKKLLLDCTMGIQGEPYF